jgi:D-beta-D-heptose 7-phosphate kinase/D-beta-D-heptose 1-phosphate adenosyltransferase
LYINIYNPAFSKKAMRIAVIGDLMLDQYDFCRNRDNPESSAPCYTVEKTEYRPGGAGNVAANLIKLGDDVLLVGILGEDENAQIIIDSLNRLGIPHKTIKDKNRPTIVKQRIMSSADKRYHLRLDREITDYIQENHAADVVENIKDCGLIIVSDYRKGMISQALMDRLRAIGIPTLVDTKPEHKQFYMGVFMIKPNIMEARKMTGIEDELKAAEKLGKDLETNVLLTKGEKGIIYLGRNGERYYYPASAGKVVDVTGAGDTVIATFAHFFSKKYCIADCVELANRAAGIAVGYPGCYAVSEEEILRE